MSDFDRTTELYVTGLTCGHCVASVTEELEEINGVKNVDVILVKGGESKVTVVTDTAIDDEAYRDAIQEAGYELVRISRDL